MRNLKETKLFKKVYGCIIGGAIGDAMGGPVEGMHYKFIRQAYGGLITDLLPYKRPEDFFQAGSDSGAYAAGTQAGTYTDDTYFQLLITKTIVEKQGRITADELAETWMREMDVSKAWHSLRNSYYKISLSRTPIREAGVGNIPDNSSAMCIGTIGVINAGDPAQAALDAYDVASLSHDGYAREAACVIASAVAEAMNPSATVNSIVEAAAKYIPNKETSRIYTPLMLALELADRASDAEELTRMYYDNLNVKLFQRGKQRPDDERHSPSVDPLEAVPCAVGMFYKAQGDFKNTVIASANYGRDCDTIACMAGYIAGAFNGIDSIPEKWIQAVNIANPVPDLEELASGLASAVIEEKKKALMRIRMIDELLDN